MRYIIETGTDVANLCFFDPAALPRDFNDQVKADSVGTFEKMEKEGRLWQKNLGSDGGYLFHFYVDEEIPEIVVKHSHDPLEKDRLLVPGGTIWACGAEYAAVDPQAGHEKMPPGGLGRFSHMGGHFSIQPGEYSITAWRTDWPEEAIQEALERRVGKTQADRLNRTGQSAALAFFISLVGTVVVVAMTAKIAGTPWLVWCWAALVFSWGVFWLLMKKVRRWEKNPVRREIEREYPSIVVQMRRISTS